MEPDRTSWGAQEYADALNSAATPADLFQLVEEVNEKWTPTGDLEPQSSRSECAEQLAHRSRIARRFSNRRATNAA